MKKRGTIKRLLAYALKSKPLTAALIFFALITAICSLSSPYIIGKAIDIVESAKQDLFDQLLPYLIILACLCIVGAASGWGLSALANKAAVDAVKTMRADGIAKIGKMPMGFIDTQSSGAMISAFTNDLDAIADGVQQALLNIFSGVLVISGCMGIMLAINPFIALAVICIAPFAAIISLVISKKTAKTFSAQRKVTAEYTGCVNEFISNQKIIKAFSYENEAIEIAQKQNQRLYKVSQNAMFSSSTVNPSSRLVGNIAYMLVGLIGGLVAIKAGSAISAGIISSMLSYAIQFSKPLNEITAAAPQFLGAIKAAERFFAFLDAPQEQEEASKPKLKSVKGEVVFENLSFSYDPDCPLIENLNLTVQRGKMAAIVGHTGAGKSTLINLLLRFYDPTAGAIYIDGVDISSVTKDSIRAAFSTVPQDIFVSGATIRENIDFGCGASDQEIEAAARAAYAHNFIMRLEKGYDTILNSEQDILSQGQKQLINIARAYLKNAPMLILDEATSNVDTRTEINIQKALQNLMKGKTGFIIAHRLSTIASADIIIVMKDGKIAQTGTHSSLMQSKGLYYSMYNGQFELKEQINDDIIAKS